MTEALAPGSRLLVVGVDVEGAEVARMLLGHGDEPNGLLAGLGWDVLRVRDVTRHPVDRHVLTMTFVVAPSLTRPRTVQPSTTLVQSARNQVNEGMAEGEAPGGEAAPRHQRVAAYAVVTSLRGFLMTQFSDRTGAEGQWGLPGGGLQEDEAPDRAAVREVWEESGQLIVLSELALIATSRWVGLAPGGQLEDFHAVRVIYRAHCPEPTQPVVHDVGGTTAAAAWVTPAQVDLLALTSGWRSILAEVTRLGVGRTDVSGVVMAPDETDRPDGNHHDTDAHDPARPES